MTEPVAIIEMNIARYREMLKTETNVDRRQTIEQLLTRAEEDLKQAQDGEAD